jgi:hypothetical protein
MTVAPAHFMEVFFTAFAINVIYMGTAFLMSMRLRMLRGRGGAAATVAGYDGNLGDTFKFIGFLFSRRHEDYQDARLSGLVTLVRVMFGVALIGTLTIFIWAGTFAFGVTQVVPQ